MIETLFNDVTLDGMRRVKVVSDAPVDASMIFPSPLPSLPSGVGNVRQWSDSALGLHYLEATWVCREAILLKLEGQPAPRPVVLWKLQAGERVSVAFGDAFAVYAERFKVFPDYAFMQRLPKEIESGFELDGVMFFAADWVPAGCIAVGNGG